MQRFWNKVDKGEHCWEWTATRHKDGYGFFWDGDRMQLAHRVAWELENRPLVKGEQVLHSCDNPPCVNPSHLRVGDHIGNMLDKARRGRAIKGERHPKATLTIEQVLDIRNRYAAGGITTRELGREYDVTNVTISRIVNRKRWGHV